MSVDVSALALSIGPKVSPVAYSFVEAYPEPLQRLDDIGLRPWDEALTIRILDT